MNWIKYAFVYSGYRVPNSFCPYTIPQLKQSKYNYNNMKPSFSERLATTAIRPIWTARTRTVQSELDNNL